MARFARLLAVGVIALVALAPVTAFAGCSSDPTAPGCMPTPPPGTATPPKTPTPTVKPTTKPATPAPTHHYVPPPVNNTTTVDNSTPEPTAFPVEVTSPSPAATTVIETQTLPGDTTTNLQTKDAASASSWIFGFAVGVLIGFLVGRASWGIKRRRRQQIFG
jgi:outer membrane biosynthesis protein TonB